jgi:cysteine desulfuration protein SufE
MSDPAPAAGVPPSIARILRRFATLSPDMTRQALVQYANRLPPLPERFQGLDPAQYRVHECQTPVAIFPEVVDGKMFFHASRPRPPSPSPPTSCAR